MFIYNYFIGKTIIIYLRQAQEAKFSQNKYLKDMLLKTRNAKLVKHIKGSEPKVANELMQTRKSLSE